MQDMNTTDAACPSVKFGDWLITLIIMLVPLLNLVMLILWSTEKNTNPSKANWARASLAVIGIQLVALMFFIGLFINSLTDAISQMGLSGLW